MSTLKPSNTGGVGDTRDGTASNGTVSLYYVIDHSTLDRADAVPLLLINGLGSPLVSYEPGLVATLTGRGFDVVRFDNRDVGKSTRFDDHTERGVAAYSIADMANDAVAVLDAVGWSEAVVVGQSMGGMIAQQLTIDHPARVRALVSLMSASGERGFGMPTKEAMATLLTPAPAEPDAWLEHRVSSEKIWASPDLWDEAWVRAKGKTLLDHGVDPAGTARQFRSIQSSGSRDEGLAGVETPTLVIHGSADTLIQPDGGRHVADVVPGAHYVEIEGMGHDLPPALWGRVAGEIGEFIDQN